MIPTKAYILKIDTPVSNGYAYVAANSCNDVGLPWEYFMGFQNMTGRMAFGKIGIPTKQTEEYRYVETPPPHEKAMCCTAGHFGIWQAIAEGPDEAAVILEHDALMLHPMSISIPENRIVVLGYKVDNPNDYNHAKAGPPREVFDLTGHEGAHAYAITRSTAIKLLEEINRKGIRSAVDNDYFITTQRRTQVPLAIVSPTPAVGWLRQSTIWAKSAARNCIFIPSFQENYK
tara:strand:+ start:267 stop:959 length:693 start_codon:yes stop_codon:yes gene_type:complete